MRSMEPELLTTQSISRKEKFRIANIKLQNRKRFMRLAHSLSNSRDHDLVYTIKHCVGKGKVGTAERIQDFRSTKIEHMKAKASVSASK